MYCCFVYGFILYYFNPAFKSFLENFFHYFQKQPDQVLAAAYNFVIILYNASTLYGSILSSSWNFG